MATLELVKARKGWHVRWRSKTKASFGQTREAFKALLDLEERAWKPEAFEGRGGWWVAAEALAKVGHLFSNYEEVLAQMEEERRQEKERRRTQARERRQQRKQEQEEARARGEVPPSTGPAKQQQKAVVVKVPKTVKEALSVLSLTPPVTLSEVKRAYRALALRHHPDHGGSHAAMVRLNAAYELAQEVC